VSAPAVCWEPGERESFFAAVARHRRAAWRVTAVCGLVLAVLTCAVAILMSPLLYGLLFIAADVLNFAVPTRDLFGPALQGVQNLMDHPHDVPIRGWLDAAMIAAAPGLAWMALVTLALGRVVQGSALFDRGDRSSMGRAPDPRVLDEQRLQNVVSEMALAAGLAPPEVLISPSSAPNAAVFGRDAQHATLVVAQGALDRLDREQLTGMAAHLIGSIANGDLEIGARVAVTLSALGLTGSLAGAFSERQAWSPFVLLARSVVHPDPRSARELEAMLADPLGPSHAARSQPGAPAVAATERARPDGKLRWQDWARMPLMGPLVLTGFLCTMVNTFALTPIMAFAWRQRKYMADATAVRLTRDPDTLAAALSTLSQATGAQPVAPWLRHMALVDPSSRGGGFMGASFVPMFPAAGRRLRALQKLGPHLQAGTRPGWTWNPVTVLLAALGLLAGVLMAAVVVMLVVLSAMMSCLFTLLPFGVLHAILRWAAHGG